jgi:hypothetical protein
MKFIFWALILIPPAIAGLGYISPYWMLGSVIVAYGKSILSVGAQIDTKDFSELSDDEFMHREKGIKLKLLSYTIVIAILYGLGRLITYLL